MSAADSLLALRWPCACGGTMIARGSAGNMSSIWSCPRCQAHARLHLPSIMAAIECGLIKLPTGVNA